MKNLGNSEDRASGSERGGGMGSVKKTEKKEDGKQRRQEACEGMERWDEIGRDMQG